MLKRYPIFAGGSAIGAAIDYAVTMTASVLVNLKPTMALGLAMVVSASIVFVFHERITFDGGARDNVRRRFLFFMLWACLIFLIRSLLLKMGLYAGLPLAVALLLAIVLASLVNFGISSTVIFATKQP